MKRMLGSTGLPQQIPNISADQQPVFDTTALAAQIDGRIIYLDLWFYQPAGWAFGNLGGAPAFWTGMSGETPYYNIDDTSNGYVYVVTSDQQNLEDAIASPARRIAAEIVKYTDPAADWVWPPRYAGIFNEFGPTHILSGYPLTPGETVHVVQNLKYTPTPPSPDVPVFVWGYYTIQGEDQRPVAARPFQPNPNVASTDYDPIIVGANETTTIHTVSDDYTDELTLELKDGNDSDTSGSYVNILTFGNGISLELPFGAATIGGTSNYPIPGSWIRWFDGIPMQGVGAISLNRSAGDGATYVRGSFKRG